jgi:putative ABC transport system permease protein
MNSLDFNIKLMKLSWNSLKASAFRSFLTTLGIIIGATTIIIVVALGEGAKRDIEAQYSNMSVTTILINAPSTAGVPSKLSIDDIPLVKTISTVADAVPMLTGKVNVSTTKNTSNFSVVGTYDDFAKVANLELVSGNFFTQQDEDDHTKVAILGATVAEELFGQENPQIIGETVILGKKEFEIIGVAKYKGGAFGPITIDESVFTPHSSSYRYVLGKNGKFSFNVNATSVDVLDETMSSLTSVLRESHNLGATGTDDFRLRDMGATVASAQSSSQTMALLLGSIGFIVLLVGGIGIMNIMYVTVSERTREIGIRKAIGAKDSFILTQFLFEAFILTTVGFITGAIISLIVYYILLSMSFKIIFVWWSVPLSFIITFIVGMFFGYLPAKKAASLDPIDALRYE